MHNPHYELEISVFFHNKVINEDIEPTVNDIKSNWRLSHSLSDLSLSKNPHKLLVRWNLL